ncbi:MAG: serine/threonine protein phosphatase [Pseudohongiella sp.]|nr:MAG: serine/threonine protein phosphatase [Pseudohongiella sp.]
MRVFAVSDIHVDYEENLDWILGLNGEDYADDILILAGDVTDKMSLLERVFDSLVECFRAVLFVPGNHELWVQEDDFDCSLQKFEAIASLCKSCGVHDDVFELGDISFVPLHSWYDFSFGEPDRHLRRAWRDFRACSWPEHLAKSQDVTEYFLSLNTSKLKVRNKTVISYSHFLPRIDVMPAGIPVKRRNVYPVLGSEALGVQVKELKPRIHVYGHSHVNQAIELDDIHFVNNAFAYPSEGHIARKQLKCIFEC